MTVVSGRISAGKNQFLIRRSAFPDYLRKIRFQRRWQRYGKNGVTLYNLDPKTLFIHIGQLLSPDNPGASSKSMTGSPFRFASPGLGTPIDKPWHRDAFIDATHRIAQLGYLTINKEEQLTRTHT